MSNDSIYYLIKSGDTLESISKKTGIPLNTLWNMKSPTFMDINNLNLGDQIVWENGVATYENHLYGPLSQKPKPSNEIIESNDSPASNNATNIEDSPIERESVSGTDGSNSPTKSCEICGENECLCEIEIIDNKQKNSHFLKGKSVLNKANNKRLTNLILFHKKLDIKYRVIGECAHNNEDKGCVSVYIKEYSDLTPNASELVERSRRNKFFGYYYNQLIEPIAKQSDVYHQTSKECESLISYTKGYDPEKKVLVSSDGNSITDAIKPNKIVDLLAFIRGLNLLIGGNLQAFPSNIYRFGVLTCTKDNKITTEHYTDFVVLPNYSVVYKGTLSFKKEYTGTSQQKTGSLSLSFTEKVHGKTENSIDYTYKKMREEHTKTISDGLKSKEDSAKKGFGSQVLDGLFKLGDFVDKYSEKPKAALDNVDNKLNTKVGIGINTLSNKKPKLFTVELLSPKLVFGAEASLRLNDNNVLDIDRSREKPDNEQEFEDPDKPFCPNGCINTPVAKDIPNRQAYEAAIQKNIDEYKNSYLRFDPLIGGVFAINLIQVIGLIPFTPLQALIKGLAFADIDIFSQLSGDELVHDKGKVARQKKLEASNGKALRIQVFLFCSFDLTFSPGLLFHNAKPDELGVSLELRGSFGSGFCMGAAGEIDVYLFQLKGATQGSYGIRFYFSLNLLTGLTKVWHDGIGGDIEKQYSVKTEMDKVGGWGDVNVGGITTKGTGIGIAGSSSTQGVVNEWVDSSYNPSVDQPFDNPVIAVPALFEDGMLWGKNPVKGITMNLPNPVSRYVNKDKLPNKNDMFNNLKGMIGGNEQEKEEYANLVNSYYQKEIRSLERQKTKHETGYWFPPTSFANPSYSFNIYTPPENESKNENV